ncbi:hypothetical protein C1H46_043321 [Malus baccata]|uniref:1-acylglycerol-3-phosphate O-acyltransferase n=1 Tax=Malus baccata TaxID=106549 RepID=A0A540KA90_MALBA|nr:hypothetical protein C1H46_043321 [Malus baccata]
MCLQIVCFLLVRPVSKSMYRKINKVVAELLWLELIWLIDWWAGIKSGFRRLEDFPMPFWLALFVEGTRFTQAKLMAAQEFAASRGLPIPRNVLLPRTKGFVSSVIHMRSFVPAIYDCTLAVPNNQPPPTLLRIFRGQSSVLKLQIRRHSMQELPETADGIGQWCKDVFVTKDALLEKYFAKGSFSDQQLQNIGRPIKSLIVVILWSILLAYGIYKFVQCSALLASWEGIAFSATFLVLIVIVMQILIQSSESERSTALTVPPKDPSQQRLIQK